MGRRYPRFRRDDIMHTALTSSSSKNESERAMDPFTRRVYLARVRDFVEGTPFPATRAQVSAFAQRKNTPSDIVHDLTRVRAERFASLDEVVDAIDALRFGAASR